MKILFVVSYGIVMSGIIIGVILLLSACASPAPKYKGYTLIVNEAKV